MNLNRVFQAGIVLCLFGIFFVAPAIESSIDRHYDHQELPPSSLDAVMRSRETNTAVSPNNGAMVWILGFALFSIAAVIGSIGFFAQKTKLAEAEAQLTKQTRLASKPQAAPMLPPAQHQPPQLRDQNGTYTHIN